jgi:hypothetical protein
VLVDGVGDGFRLERVVIRLRVEVRGDRGAGEPDPELRGGTASRDAAGCRIRWSGVVVDQLEAGRT